MKTNGRLVWVFGMLVFASAVGIASTARAQNCNGTLNISIPPPPPPPTVTFLTVGDQTTVAISLGSGPIDTGQAGCTGAGTPLGCCTGVGTGTCPATITIHRVRYELDCNDKFALGVPCTDQGDIMSYVGPVTSGGTLCSTVSWTARPSDNAHCTGAGAPDSCCTGTGTGTCTGNEIVFTPSPEIMFSPGVDASTFTNCTFSFPVKLDNFEPTSGTDADNTPHSVQVVAGYNTGTFDATCINGGQSGAQNTSGVPICQSCPTCQQCNTSTGLCANLADSQTDTRCTDTDGTLCTKPGCEAGACVQAHIPAPTCPTCQECKANTGQCGALNDSQTDTRCTDTDASLCTKPGCEAGSCVQSHIPPPTCTNPQCNECKADTGQCGPITPTPAGCGVEICRTPGFWGTHAGREKARSQNITQAVLNAAGGCIEICGEIIDNTLLNSADSAVEAICVSPRGTQELQLVRQLTATALNCIITNGSPDCTNVSIQDVFQACDAACAAGDPSAADTCIGLLDCFNNGGTIDNTGSCVSGGTNNCHNQPLINDSLNLNFEPPGPAGSSNECNDALGNTCTVIPPGETSCGTGLKCSGTETCGQTSCP